MNNSFQNETKALHKEKDKTNYIRSLMYFIATEENEKCIYDRSIGPLIHTMKCKFLLIILIIFIHCLSQNFLSRFLW